MNAAYNSGSHRFYALFLIDTMFLYQHYLFHQANSSDSFFSYFLVIVLLNFTNHIASTYLEYNWNVKYSEENIEGFLFIA